MVPAELLGLEKKELVALLAAWGQPPYRADQLFSAIYNQRLRDPEAISTFPRALRARLAAETRITWPVVEQEFLSRDGTRRYLLRLEDGETIETVLMPEEARDTICISTQAGCLLNCGFCLTALLGLKRNLTAGEIVGQALLSAECGMRNAELNDTPHSALHTPHSPPTPHSALRIPHSSGTPHYNLVFMGMGEPLLNYDATLKAVRLLAACQRLGITTRRMTLSTAGIVPKIEALGREPVRPKLAISLNATTDEIRTRLMPINEKWPIARLMEACRMFPLRPGERLTFEYVLLDGVNDTPADARRLVKLVGGLRAKVNLMGWNPGPELPYRTPPEERVLAFQQVLADSRISAFIRKPRGRDISAACGQLKRTVA
jgi:23S rRNA (adenine2503-C2)-methyltransferase